MSPTRLTLTNQFSRSSIIGSSGVFGKSSKLTMKATTGMSFLRIEGHRREFTALAMQSASTVELLPSYSLSKLSLRPVVAKPQRRVALSRAGELRDVRKEGNQQKILRYGYDKPVSENQLIGQGFFAKVYKGNDKMTTKSVAVKVINKKDCPKEVYSQELKVMSMLTDLKLKISPSGEGFEALGLHTDAFETSDSMCFVFDYQKGGDLFDEVVDNGTFSEGEAQTLLNALLPSLQTMHRHKFVHRDIKLENILLESDAAESAGQRAEKLGSAKLTDFGYSKRLGQVDNFRTPAGTFGYVAPEILTDRKYSTACDIWSLGVVLFSSVAGYQPFPYQSTSPSNEGASNDEIQAREIEAIDFGRAEECWEKELSKPAFQDMSPEFKDLLSRMLDPTPETRITAEGIMNHVWLSQPPTGCSAASEACDKLATVEA